LSAVPAVSVCIPAYRGAAHIGEAIESVLAQTFADFELVVVDDASPDDTAQWVARYDDPRIRFLRNERNAGVQANWNRCLELARGRYFKLLPQDDLIAPECLARELEVLDADRAERLALVFCARSIIDRRSRSLMTRGYPSRTRGAVAARTMWRKCMHRGTNLMGEPGGVLFRTALGRRIGGFDASIGNVTDLDCWFRLLLHGDAYYLPERLASFRVAPGSWSLDIGARQAAHFRAFVARVGANPVFGLSRLDMARGRLMSQANTLARLVLYKLVVR
jgi:glycosyltransferase involved in cell wall biosynthesis